MHVTDIKPVDGAMTVVSNSQPLDDLARYVEELTRVAVTSEFFSDFAVEVEAGLYTELRRCALFVDRGNHSSWQLESVIAALQKRSFTCALPVFAVGVNVTANTSVPDYAQVKSLIGREYLCTGKQVFRLEMLSRQNWLSLYLINAIREACESFEAMRSRLKTAFIGIVADSKNPELRKIANEHAQFSPARFMYHWDGERIHLWLQFSALCAVSNHESCRFVPQP